MKLGRRKSKPGAAQPADTDKVPLRPFLLAGVVTALVLGSIYAYQRYAEYQVTQQSELAQSQAEAVISSIAQRIKSTRDAIENTLDPAPLRAALRDGDRVAAGDALASSHADVIFARLLAPGERRVDYSLSPPFGYAARRLARRAEEQERSMPMEAHLFGTEEQSLAFVSRIKDPDDKLAGLVLWGLDAKIPQRLLDQAPPASTYVELRQLGGRGTVVLAKRGDGSLRQGSPILRNVPGSRWTLGAWAAVPGTVGFLQSLPVVSLAGFAALALSGLYGVLAYRQYQANKPVPEAEAEEAEAAEEPPQESELLPPAAPAVYQVESATEDDIPVPAELPSEPESEPEPVTLGPPLEELPPGPAGDVPASVFRAYDIRGVVGETLEPDGVRLIGRAIGSEALARGQQTLVVARDGRHSGPELVEALIEGLRTTGRDVIDIGRVPTPVLYYATYYLNTGSGVMVTGSHNPPAYNGLKMMLGEETLSGEAIQSLRERIEGGNLDIGSGGFQTLDVASEYIRRVTEDISVALGNSFTVVVDCGNGVAGELAPKLLRALGHDVIELYCEVDGSFPNHHPDPSQPENLQDLIAAVAEYDADLGLAFDGDGDRLGVVDKAGRIIWPDRQMMLYARDVLSRNPGAEVIFDVKCSRHLPKVIEEAGGKATMVRTGHSFIKQAMRETGAALGGEMSGHIFFKERWFGFDDGLYTAARLLEILLGMDESPSEVFAALPDAVSTPELRIDMAEGQHTAFMERLIEADPFASQDVTTIDGLRVDYDNGWGLVRPSNTTASLVLRFEADDETALAQVQDAFRAALLSVDDSVSLPF